jgi:hypothetical protein
VCRVSSYSTAAEEQYRSGYCTTPACSPNGTWNVGSSYYNDTCYDDVNDDGDCNDPTDLRWVTCAPYDTNGTWNCDGSTCSVTYYNSTCDGHW